MTTVGRRRGDGIVGAVTATMGRVRAEGAVKVMGILDLLSVDLFCGAGTRCLAIVDEYRQDTPSTHISQVRGLRGVSATIICNHTKKSASPGRIGFWIFFVCACSLPCLQCLRA